MLPSSSSTNSSQISACVGPMPSDHMASLTTALRDMKISAKTEPLDLFDDPEVQEELRLSGLDMNLFCQKSQQAERKQEVEALLKDMWLNGPGKPFPTGFEANKGKLIEVLRAGRQELHNSALVLLLFSYPQLQASYFAAVRGGPNETVSGRVCQWVVQKVAPEVRCLDLSHMGVPCVSRFIVRITALRSLTLAHNKLRTVPKEIKALQALEQLDISDNLLSSLPEQLGLLPNLVFLNVQRNPFLKALPNSFLKDKNVAIVPSSDKSFFAVPPQTFLQRPRCVVLVDRSMNERVSIIHLIQSLGESSHKDLQKKDAPTIHVSSPSRATPSPLTESVQAFQRKIPQDVRLLAPPARLENVSKTRWRISSCRVPRQTVSSEKKVTHWPSDGRRWERVPSKKSSSKDRRRVRYMKF